MCAVCRLTISGVAKGRIVAASTESLRSAQTAKSERSEKPDRCHPLRQKCMRRMVLLCCGQSRTFVRRQCDCFSMQSVNEQCRPVGLLGSRIIREKKQERTKNKAGKRSRGSRRNKHGGGSV